jgi:FixJ family two-component response regulator
VATQPLIVAVVEDDASVRRSYERLLNASGFTTESYASAEAFLEAKADWRPGCLVLDIQLPGMSGIDLRRRLKASGSKMPVIFITALEDDGVEREAVKGGCVAYLRKPFSGKLLVGAVKKALADLPVD